MIKKILESINESKCYKEKIIDAFYYTDGGNEALQNIINIIGYFYNPEIEAEFNKKPGKLQELNDKVNKFLKDNGIFSKNCSKVDILKILLNINDLENYYKSYKLKGI